MSQQHLTKDQGRLEHVAIIMDGNRRWAKERNLPGVEGYRQGVLALRPLIERCGELGIGTLTLFAFSTENWARPASEVGFLMGLIEEFFFKEIYDLHEKGVCIRILGELTALPERPRSFVERAVQMTKENTKLRLNIALNYGGRAEIVRAARALATMAKEGRIDPEKIDESAFEDCLYTKGLADVDLLIRTSGENRISNFLLYQIAYAELVVMDCCWPDFGKEQLDQALEEYFRRNRRFGKI